MDVVVVTDEERSLYPTQTMGLFHEALEDKKIQLLITREISLEFFSPHYGLGALLYQEEKELEKLLRNLGQYL